MVFEGLEKLFETVRQHSERLERLVGESAEPSFISSVLHDLAESLDQVAVSMRAVCAERTRLVGERNHEATAAARYRNLFDTARSQIASIVEYSDDAIVGGTMDGLISSWNSGAERLYGYRTEEVMGRPVSMLLPTERIEEVSQILDALRSGKRVEQRETVHVRKDGGRIDVSLTVSAILNSAGEIVGASMIARDITRRRTEAELESRDRTLQADRVGTVMTEITERKRAERKFRAFLESAPDAMVIVDQQGRIVLVNSQTEKIFGYPRAELLDKDVEMLVPQRLRAGRPEHCAWLKAAPTDQPMRFDSDLYGLRKNGTEFPMEVSLSPLETEEGILISNAIRDISERKAAERELRQINDRLHQTLDELAATQRQVIQQERLRALGQMASGIAHDFNNSLSPVLGYSEILLDDPELPERMRRPLQLIHTGASDAANVVERLQDFYRPKLPGVARPVELSDLVRQVCLLTRPKWRDEAQRTGRTIDVQLDMTDSVTIMGNPPELREVLINLVLNAVDAMPNGGRLMISLHTSDQFVTLAVADTGQGMAEHVRARCFEPFFSTKGPDGSGLGLSVCHGIVQRHHGRIEIDTRVGSGTTFTIYFPRTTQPSTEEATRPLTRLARRRMLYIDDDPRVRSTVARMLQELDQEVELAESGYAGIEMFRNKTYDVVITDLGMPQLDGWYVTHAIKTIRHDVPVVMLTGWGSPYEPVQSAWLHKPNCIVGKPLTAAKLRAAIEKLGDSAASIGPTPDRAS